MRPREFALMVALCAVLGGFIAGALTLWVIGPMTAPDPDPLVCSRIWAALNDPESQGSRTPGELEQAWDDEGCAEVGK